MTYPLRLTVIFVLTVGIIGCDPLSDPDCGSSSTKSLIGQIAKEKNAFYRTIFFASNNVTSRIDNPYGLSDCDQKRQDIAAVTCRKNEELISSIKDDFDLAFSKISYTLDTIRITNRDPQTKKVECIAILRGDIPDWGSADKEITYSVEQTSDGGIYVTVN